MDTLASSDNPLTRKPRRPSRQPNTAEGRTRNEEFNDPRRPQRRATRNWGERIDVALYKESLRIAAEIDANPEETARLERSESDVREGRIRWDDDDSARES
jgi:hypothetical protein